MSSDTTKKVEPPGELAQKINKFLHIEPYSYIFHAIFWSGIFLIACPIIGIALLWNAFFKGMKYFLGFDTGMSFIDAKQTSKDLAVYITGCDTGFGKDLAFALSTKGYTVFPGCLTDAGIQQYEGDYFFIKLLFYYFFYSSLLYIMIHFF